jgi:hypothetical protein
MGYAGVAMFISAVTMGMPSQDWDLGHSLTIYNLALGNFQDFTSPAELYTLGVKQRPESWLYSGLPQHAPMSYRAEESQNKILSLPVNDSTCGHILEEVAGIA